jgi:hypothetical protein
MPGLKFCVPSAILELSRPTHQIPHSGQTNLTRRNLNKRRNYKSLDIFKIIWTFQSRIRTCQQLDCRYSTYLYIYIKTDKYDYSTGKSNLYGKILKGKGFQSFLSSTSPVAATNSDSSASSTCWRSSAAPGRPTTLLPARPPDIVLTPAHAQ